MNFKGYERSGRRLVYDSPWIFLEELKKTTGKSVETVSTRRRI
jgi:hypothetical protein